MTDAPPDTPEVLWSPRATEVQASAISHYMNWLGDTWGVTVTGYDELWRWSVADLDSFWSSMWEYFDLPPRPRGPALSRGASVEDAVWFPGAQLNYAAHLLRDGGTTDALVARSQTRADTTLSRDELRDAVARCRTGLRSAGVTRGSRVVAYLPNIPETVIAFLAVASLGAIWASCPPEFGPKSVLDRFGQLDPVVLLAVGGYVYGEKHTDRTEAVATIRAGLPTLRAVVDIPYLGAPIPDAIKWTDLLAVDDGLAFDDVPFDHPLYVLFSSGTTGLPKAIVHRHGGILLEHLKVLALHHDLGPEDRFFWYTTTGWMMWNFMVSALALGTSLVLFDGDPAHPDLAALWRSAGETSTTVFGVSASFLMACRKAGQHVGALAPGVRSIGSTGAPLPAEGFRWVYEQFPNVFLISISGGTDVCSAFVGGAPILPVVAGEMSCRLLGAKVEAYDPSGEPVVGTEGELVLTAPMPSMPIGLWNDDDGERFHNAYFAAYPGVWCHGDWLTVSGRGTCTITGRSDATLNRGGVRLGTSEFYSVVEALPEIADSLVVHLDDPTGPGQLVLFVALCKPGTELPDPVRIEINRSLRTALSPRHVPDELYAVRVIPRTHSGKKLEIPVKQILLGRPAAEVASPSSLQSPTSLDPIAQIAVRRRLRTPGG
jgi:acetoacetyl-CoA synthetase